MCSRLSPLQWRKSNTLEATLKLLDDIQQVVDTPGKIDEALAVKVRKLHKDKALGLATRKQAMVQHLLCSGSISTVEKCESNTAVSALGNSCGRWLLMWCSDLLVARSDCLID